MMVGTPVLTTKVCGNPELVKHQHNGILVHPGNVQELTEQIELVLYKSSLSEQLAGEGKRSIQRFSWKQLLRETMKVLCK